MIVVQDEDDLIGKGGQVIEQGRQNRIGWRWLGRLERSPYPFPKIGRNRLQSRDEVGQKAGGVVIPFVQGQPGNRSPKSEGPFTEQRGFAKASRGRDEDQFAVQPLVEPLKQAGAADHVGSKR